MIDHMPRKVVPALALVAALSGCGASAHAASLAEPAERERERDLAEPATRATVTTAAPGPPLCRFEGPLSTSQLRTREAGVWFAYAGHVAAHAELRRAADGALRVEVDVEDSGWHVRGRLDPTADDGLHASATLWLTDGVGIVAGADLVVLDARDGELLVGPAQPHPRDAIRYVGSISQWLPCAAVRLEGLSSLDRAAQRRELGLPEGATEVRVDVPMAAPIALTPDGEPVAELGPGERIALLVIEETATHQRVIRHVRDGGAVVGWVARTALRPPSPENGALSALGALMGGPGWYDDRCTSRERVDIVAATDSAREAVGWIAAGTPFARREHRDDGSFVIASGYPLSIGPFTDVAWIGVSTGALSCIPGRRPPPLSRGSVGPREVQTRTHVLAATVVGSDVDGIDVGASCELRLTHPEEGEGSCRASVRCGREYVYGDRSTQGTFRCAVAQDEGSGPAVVGRDGTTSTGDDTPALSIDTRAGTVSVLDDPSGSLGAIHVHLRIAE